MARLSRVEKLKQGSAHIAPAPAVLQGDTLSILNQVAERCCNGKLGPTVRKFLFDPDPVKWLTGAAGTGKTTALIASALVPAMMMPASRWFIGRLVYWTLMETTIKQLILATERIGPKLIIDREKGPPFRLWIASALRKPDGRPEEPSEILCHSLDDMDKLGSTEFTGVAVDEANEISSEVAHTLDLRTRLKRINYEPPGPPTGPFFLNLASNPVRRSHWLHWEFCGEEDCRPVAWGKKYRVPKEENMHNLPGDYYERLAASLPPEMRIRYVEGECGPDVHGRPVFPEYASNLHAGDLEYHRGLPIIRGWDAGKKRPCCVYAQLHPNGWLNVLGMKMGDNVLVDTFADQVLSDCKMRFPDTVMYRDFGDPHGDQKREMSEKTPWDVLREKGIGIRCQDRSIRFGLDAVAKMLSTLIEKRPRLMVHRVNANTIVEAFAGGYTWPEFRAGRVDSDKPYPDGYYEHPMDCVRYICAAVESGMTGANRDAKVLNLRFRR